MEDQEQCVREQVANICDELAMPVPKIVFDDAPVLGITGLISYQTHDVDMRAKKVTVLDEPFLQVPPAAMAENSRAELSYGLTLALNSSQNEGVTQARQAGSLGLSILVLPMISIVTGLVLIGNSWVTAIVFAGIATFLLIPVVCFLLGPRLARPAQRKALLLTGDADAAVSYLQKMNKKRPSWLPSAIHSLLLKLNQPTHKSLGVRDKPGKATPLPLE